MDNQEASPDGEITFRPTSHRPKFADLTELPTTLKALQRADRGTPRPTEMSALAQRLRSVRLDRSPESSPDSRPSSGIKARSTKPCRRLFAAERDKENVQNTNSPQLPSSSPEKSSVLGLEIIEHPAFGTAPHLDLSILNAPLPGVSTIVSTPTPDIAQLQQLSSSDYALQDSDDFLRSSSSKSIPGTKSPEVQKLALLTTPQRTANSSDDALLPPTFTVTAVAPTPGLGPKFGELSSSDYRLNESEDLLRSSESSDYFASAVFDNSDSDEAKSSTGDPSAPPEEEEALDAVSEDSVQGPAPCDPVAAVPEESEVIPEPCDEHVSESEGTAGEHNLEKPLDAEGETVVVSLDKVSPDTNSALEEQNVSVSSPQPAKAEPDADSSGMETSVNESKPVEQTDTSPSLETAVVVQSDNDSSEPKRIEAQLDTTDEIDRASAVETANIELDTDSSVPKTVEIAPEPADQPVTPLGAQSVEVTSSSEDNVEPMENNLPSVSQTVLPKVSDSSSGNENSSPVTTPVKAETLPTETETSGLRGSEMSSDEQPTQSGTEAMEVSDAEETRRTEQDVEDHDLTTNMQIIIDGREKWNWAERCGAMSLVARRLQSSSATVLIVKEALPTLTNKLIDHLDELRPTVITSALSLVNAIVSTGCDKGTSFAEDVFPSVLDLACGRSLTAEAAARSVATLLNAHESLAAALAESDNPEHLRKFLMTESESPHVDAFPRSLARRALETIDKWMATNGHAVASYSEQEVDSLPTRSGPSEIGKSTLTGAGSPSTLHFERKLQTPTSESRSSKSVRVRGADRTPSSSSSSPSPPPTSRSSSISSFTRLSGAGAASTKPLERGLLVSSSPKIPLRPTSSPHSTYSGTGTPVLQNMKLSGSSRKTSPGSRRRRMYTEDEMIEARQNATRIAMEEARQAQAVEKEAFRRERSELEERVRSEHVEVVELKSVLQEYELTMQRMVSQMNSKANAEHSTLEMENNKLKGELLEVGDAFAKLKEKYETAKQTIAVLENKENRLIEQHKELKKNMVELQKWSNDLKANSEKKLALAFENVTKCRSSYMDKEAHASKAFSDLAKTRSELEREVSSHAETAAALSRAEGALHVEEDKTSSLRSSLETTRESLAQITAQRDQMKLELRETKPKLDKALAELERLHDAESRASEAEGQLSTIAAETRTLKARAYDDMTKIRALETELALKEKEHEELSSICEEAMSRLEQSNS